MSGAVALLALSAAAATGGADKANEPRAKSSAAFINLIISVFPR
jgi:hypothetical protein